MKKIFVANWKSNKNFEEVEEYLENFKPYLEDDKEVVFAPPASFLEKVGQFVENLPQVSLGIQNLSSFPAGSYTGEVCGRNLENLGVKYAILGHSERRRYLGETSLDVAHKVEQALMSDIIPIVCIDEPYLLEQSELIKADLKEQCLVAYEPLSAIGTGESAQPQAVHEMVEHIKKVFAEVKVLYGGSVDAANVNDFLELTDGVLVGTASLEVKDFIDLIQAARVE